MQLTMSSLHSCKQKPYLLLLTGLAGRKLGVQIIRECQQGMVLMVHVSSLFRPQGTVASTASCLQLHKRAERVAAALMGRLNTGDHVALVYPPGTMERCHFKFSTFQIGVFVRIARVTDFPGLNINVCFAGVDLIATFYGCLYAGCVPVTVRPPHPQNLATTLPTVKMIVEVTFSVGFALLCMRAGGCVSYNSWCVVFTFNFCYLCVKGQQVGVHPDHSGHHEAAEIQRRRCRRGHQELAHGAGHR